MLLIEDAPLLKKNFKHDIDVVVDRFIVREEASARLADSLETAIGLTDGLATVENADDGTETVFSSRFACPISGFTIPEIEPRLFSFNNPFGACPVCDGIGTEQHCDAELVVPNPLMSMRDGAIAPWASSNSSYYEQTLEGGIVCMTHISFAYLYTETSSTTLSSWIPSQDTGTMIAHGIAKAPIT